MRLVIVLLLLCACLAGCDGATCIDGRIFDDKKTPLKGAEVILLAPGRDRYCSSVTKADGSYSVGFTHAPVKLDLAFVVSKDGFKTHVESIVSGAHHEYTVILTPRQEASKPR
jgi:hypothetical protein